MDASFFYGRCLILEQEPRLHHVLLIVSSNWEFDLNSAMNYGESVSTTASVMEINWSSYKGLTVDTQHTEAMKDIKLPAISLGSWKHALIQEFPIEP